MTNKDQKIITKLEKHANEFLKKEFNLTLEIPIKISGRLKRAAGMYSYLYDEYSKKITPQKIQIARFAVENNTVEDVIDTLEHELVHYALCIRGEKFHDEDLNFINTCKRLGVPLSHDLKSDYKIFKCKKCGKITKSYTDISKKYFHKCGGVLELIGMELLRASEKPTLTAKTDEKPQKTTTKKLQNQKSKHTTELLKDLNLTELQLKHYPNLKLFMQGAYKEDGDVVTLYSYTTKIMQKSPSKKELKTKEMKELKEAGYTYDEIKKYHYIKIQGVYMKLLERTPPIKNRIIGSFLGENVENTYENFKRYNMVFSSNCLSDVGIEQAEKSIFFGSKRFDEHEYKIQYCWNENGLINYFQENEADVYILTKEEKNQVIDLLKERQKRFIKRLETYYKRYKDKIIIY